MVRLYLQRGGEGVRRWETEDRVDMKLFFYEPNYTVRASIVRGAKIGAKDIYIHVCMRRVLSLNPLFVAPIELYLF